MSAAARAPLLGRGSSPTKRDARTRWILRGGRQTPQSGRSQRTDEPRARHSCSRSRAANRTTRRVRPRRSLPLRLDDLGLIRRHRVQSLICSLRISFRPAEGEGDRLPLHLGDVLVDAALIESFKTGHADVQRESPLSGLRLLSYPSRCCEPRPRRPLRTSAYVCLCANECRRAARPRPYRTRSAL